MSATPPDLRRRMPLLFITGGILFLLMIVGPAIAGLYTDLRWFRSLGYETVFTTVLWTRVAVGLVVGLLTTAFFYGNLALATRLTAGMRGFVLPDPQGVARVELGPLAKRLALPAALVVGLFFGLSASTYWDTWLKWSHASDFGTADPIFGRDVGFYVFQLPALRAVSTLLSTWLGGSLVILAAMYVARGALMYGPGGVQAQRSARTHLSVIAALFLCELAYEAWLGTAGLLFSEVGPVSGASYADVQAKLPALYIQMGLAVISAVLVVVSATRKRFVLLIGGVALYAASEILGVRVYPATVHSLSVAPNEAKKEAPYIRYNIDATREAFGLSNVAERELVGDFALTRSEIDENRATIENIRLWDHEPLLDTFAQIQEIRTYYEFSAVDNDRYMIDGQLRQTMLSARELAVDSLPDNNWINRHFAFTHGYGVTMGPVNVATNEGLPQLFVKDIPPASELSALNVTRPAIYFGELTNDYAVVRTANQEFDYPSGSEQIYTEYAGADGIHLDSFITHLAIATSLRDLKLLLSDGIREDTRVLLHRNIQERAIKVAPFLRFDGDPYMVVGEGGRLVWIQDAYTASDLYPYSQPYNHRRLGRFNYIRNSVKVVIDAYDGTLDLYVADEEDPLLKTWREIFPEVFRPLSDLSEDLRSHLRYPEDLFRVQTDTFTVYHMNSPELVYSREDQWEIPAIGSGETLQPMGPYYTVMKLPGEEREEFIQMLPFTPKSKDNLAAWMVARSDAPHMGEIVVYSFPKDRLVYGPQQVMNRINQDADISRQLSLWDQRGSEAILGTLLVIPIAEALIYVCPLYLRSEGGRIPELKRVVVAYENQIAMEVSLDRAIAVLFPPGEPTGEPAVSVVVEDAPPTAPGAAVTEPAPLETGSVAVRARQYYERAVEAQRAGDWATYGEELQKLGEVLQELAPASD